MGHLREYRAAVAGKRRGNKNSQKTDTHMKLKRLIFAVVTLFVASVSGSASYAQSGPFAGMAGVWSGSGTVTLDDGSSERIRCRATYAVSASGSGLNQSLVCASDSYKFDLKANVVAERGSLSGTWSESSRNINGNLEGHASSGNFQVLASAPGFSADISLVTRGNTQNVSIAGSSSFKGATITLTLLRRDRLTPLRLGQPRCGFVHGLCDQQRLFLVDREILDAFVRGQRKHHDVGLVLGPAGGEAVTKSADAIGRASRCNPAAGTNAVTSISTLARISTSPSI